jgi:hypothetical protein
VNCSPRPLKFLAVADLQHAITQQRGILLDHCSYTLGDDELLPADRRCGFKGGGIFLAGALVRLGTDRQPFGGRGPAGDCVNPQSPNDAKDSAVMDANMGSRRLFCRSDGRLNAGEGHSCRFWHVRVMSGHGGNLENAYARFCRLKASVRA